MYDSPFFTAGVIGFVYFFLRFIEMKFVIKEAKPIKILFRDSLLVFISVLLGNHLLMKMKPLKNLTENTKVFVNDPEF